MYILIGAAYRDLEAAECMAEQADINSLAVQAVTLTNGDPTGKAGPENRFKISITVKRSDVAKWMLDVADGT